MTNYEHRMSRSVSIDQNRDTNPDVSNDAADPVLRRNASAQLGLLTQTQISAMSSRSVHRRTDGREWVRESNRVIRHVAAPRSDPQRALAAVLDAGSGALLSHGSAAALWGLPGFTLCPAHVVTERRSHPVDKPIGTVHRMRALTSSHGTALDGIPVVRPELLALQLCATVSAGRAERLFDRLWSMRLLSGPSTRKVLDAISGSGVRGVAVLRAILDARGADYVPPASGLEGRFARIIEDACMPAMKRQVDLGGTSWSGRVDFFDPECGLVVEVDSERYHRALGDVEADGRRAVRLEAAGFVVVRVTDTQVFHRPGEVVEVVRQGRHRARAHAAS